MCIACDRVAIPSRRMTVFGLTRGSMEDGNGGRVFGKQKLPICVREVAPKAGPQEAGQLPASVCDDVPSGGVS